ncbi:TrbG/VirB9 family P-type conjugative transfer protein [Pseudomonas aeruginosa]|nr:TrbG/VirB9 family P-type conjugative transfer protein [Pseudomonas aeruginosa]MDR9475709.1 TrbG/VirB9 family P-type conjugative transfer protein [Pseudomonas aeruginosa]
MPIPCRLTPALQQTSLHQTRCDSVMDDGQFTKFLLKKGADMPQFYRVLPDGTEAMVNKRREGDYVVVERLDSMFVLRDGNAHVCVENLANPYKRTVTRGVRDGGGA